MPHWKILTFQSIDLSQHADVAIACRRDAYRVTTGSERRFDETIGSEAYLKWLSNRIKRSPMGQVHVWRGNEIIGQIEARPQRNDPERGCVNLYYLMPRWRGRGFGSALDRYVTTYFQSLGIKYLSLNVNQMNQRAYQFYLAQGWTVTGPTPGVDSQLRMEKEVSQLGHRLAESYGTVSLN